MAEEYFNSLLRGDQGALKRALYKAVGFTDNALKKPIIALVNTYTNASPGHSMLNDICHQVERGVEAAGGTAMTFSTIAPCDGIAEGHEGMRYILPARDLITSTVECMVRAHRFDGMVLIGSCDKIVPGLLMAAARLDIPAVVIGGGPMTAASTMTATSSPKRLAGSSAARLTSASSAASRIWQNPAAARARCSAQRIQWAAWRKRWAWRSPAARSFPLCMPNACGWRIRRAKRL